MIRLWFARSPCDKSIGNHHARVAVVLVTAALVLVDKVAEAVGDVPVGLPVAC
jgi:hypothetical protein